MPEEPQPEPPEELTAEKRVAPAERPRAGLNHECSAVSELTPSGSESPIRQLAEEQLPHDAEEEAGEPSTAKAGDAWVSEFRGAELPGLQPARGGLSGPRMPLVAWVAVLVLTASAGLLWRFRPQPPKAASHVSHPKPAAQNRAEPKPGGAVPEAATTASKPAIPQAAESGKAAAPVQITGLEHMSHQGTTSVVIHLTGKVEYEEHRLSGPERIYLDIPHTQLTPELLGKKSQVNELLVRKIRIAQPLPSVTRLTIETAGYCDYKIVATSDQLAIEVRRQH
jgi:AMIN domain